MNASFVRKLLLATLLSALGCALATLLGAWLYFQYHSRDAESLALMRGALQLTDPKFAWVELEPGRLMFRSGDIRDGQFAPVDAYLGRWGWQFQEQMGAGLLYRRGAASLDASFFSCGPNYAVAVFYNDPSSGRQWTLRKPFNLFG